MEKLLFLATFFLSLTSLVLLSAPAIQHRLMRPFNNRARFKRIATRQIVAGAFEGTAPPQVVTEWRAGSLPCWKARGSPCRGGGC